MNTATIRGTVLLLLGLSTPLGAAVIHDNGPLVTATGTGAGGSDVSVVQTWLGNFSYGVSVDKAAGHRLADDFVVPAGGWTIARVAFFAYGRDSGFAPTALNLRIWDGVPGAAGSSIVFGDTTTNRLASVSGTNIHRTAPDAPADPARPIMKLVAMIGGLELSAGTYWLDWQIDAGSSGEAWSPFVTLDDVPLKPGSNALLWNPDGETWTRVRDADSNKSQDLPFLIEDAEQGDLIFADGFEP